MIDCNTNKDFLKFAVNNWYKRSDAKDLLLLLKEFCYSSLSKDKWVLLSWLVTFRIKDTTTTLHPGKIFKKVKALPSIKLLKLIAKKW